MRGYKFELWVIIFLQLVMLETTVEKPNLLPVLLAFGGFIFMRKVTGTRKEKAMATSTVNITIICLTLLALCILGGGRKK